MKVKCINNNTQIIDYWPKTATPVEELLQIEKIYDVYGLYLGEPMAYEVLLDESDDHTIDFPAYMFKVLDNRLPSFFVLGESERFDNNGKTKTVPFISFPEWANDKLYFEKLVDGDQKSQEIFDNYKCLIYLKE